MKQIVKSFNNLVKKTIFKVQNKTNNKLVISNFNKYLITFISVLFFYIFYLLIPLLYDKDWVQSSIESKLLNEFKINLSSSADISYRILPAPHYLIKDSKIFSHDVEKQKIIAEIKDLKIFLTQNNFFDREKIALKKISINNANFSLLRDDLKLLSQFKNKEFSNKKIMINNSNIFFKDNLGKIITIIKVNNTVLFSDDEKILNFFELNGEVFNVPFTLDIENHNVNKKYEKINFNSNSLKLNIYNESNIEKDESINGKNIISFFNFVTKTNYSVEKKLIIFKSNNSKKNNLQFDYRGELSINPFDLNLDIHLENFKISKLFSINTILSEFIQSELLFNDNISVNTSITINSNLNKEIFQNAKINFNIINGRINFNKSNFTNDEIGSLELNNSNLFFKNNRLIFNTDILVNIKNSDRLFSLLNTNKSSRKNIESILINLDYDFLTDYIEFNDVQVDGAAASDKAMYILEGFTDNKLNNIIKSRKLINELLKEML